MSKIPLASLMALLAVSACDQGAPATNAVKATVAPEARSLTLPAGVLGAAPLVAYMNAALAYKPADEFSKSFDDSALIGRQFRVTIPYEQYDRGPSYRYDADKEILTVTVYPENNLHGDKRDGQDLDYVILSKEPNFGSPTPESNAFGVAKDVIPASYKIIGLGSVGNDYMGVFGKDTIEGKIFTYKSLDRQIPLKPDAARQATVGLTMDLEGSITKNENGRAILCQHSTRPATLTYNYEETFDECVLSVKLSRVVVSSPALGTIGDWTEAAARRAPRHKR